MKFRAVTILLVVLLGAFVIVEVAGDKDYYEDVGRDDGDDEDDEDEDDDDDYMDEEPDTFDVMNVGSNRDPGTQAETDPSPTQVDEPNTDQNITAPDAAVDRFPRICFTSDKCNKYWGTCKSYCSSNEQVIRDGCQGIGCVCCAMLSCTKLQACREKWGTCRTSCEHGESELLNGCIGGSGCKCCYKPKPLNVCKMKPHCAAYNGVCRSTGCNEDERDIPGGCEGSQGKQCWCCAPKQKCEAFSKCTLRKGTCKKECDSNETYIRKGCYGHGCKCCVPKNTKCTINNNCLSRGGVCKDWCSNHEKEIRNGCQPRKGGGNNQGGGSYPHLLYSYNNDKKKPICKCCAPKKCVRNKKCGRYKGKCKKYCGDYEYEVKGGCFGSGKKKCRCCAAETCTESKKCNQYYGKCQKSKCGRGYTEVPNACHNWKGGCYCCAPESYKGAIAKDPELQDYNFFGDDYSVGGSGADYY